MLLRQQYLSRSKKRGHSSRSPLQLPSSIAIGVKSVEVEIMLVLLWTPSNEGEGAQKLLGFHGDHEKT